MAFICCHNTRKGSPTCCQGHLVCGKLNLTEGEKQQSFRGPLYSLLMSRGHQSSLPSLLFVYTSDDWRQRFRNSPPPPCHPCVPFICGHPSYAFVSCKESTVVGWAHHSLLQLASPETHVSLLMRQATFENITSSYIETTVFLCTLGWMSHTPSLNSDPVCFFARPPYWKKEKLSFCKEPINFSDSYRFVVLFSRIT